MFSGRSIRKYRLLQFWVSTLDIILVEIDFARRPVRSKNGIRCEKIIGAASSFPARRGWCQEMDGAFAGSPLRKRTRKRRRTASGQRHLHKNKYENIKSRIQPEKRRWKRLQKKIELLACHERNDSSDSDSWRGSFHIQC